MRRIFIVVVFFLLAGCSALTGPSPTPVYVPPTPVKTSSPVGASLITTQPSDSTQAAESTLPTAPADCVDNLSFLSDITIPDGTEVEAEATLDKRWEVENSGNCNWQAAYRVRLIAGPEMGAQREQALYPARSGSKAVLRILFKAPTEPGTYRSAWQAIDPQGEAFGDPFFIEINVIE